MKIVIVLLIAVAALLTFLWSIASVATSIGILTGCKVINNLLVDPSFIDSLNKETYRDRTIQVFKDCITYSGTGALEGLMANPLSLEFQRIGSSLHGLALYQS